MGFHCKTAAGCVVRTNDEMHLLGSRCALCLAGLTGFKCAGTDSQFPAGTRRHQNQSPRSLGERTRPASSIRQRHEALQAYYQTYGGELLWLGSNRASAFVSRLKEAEADGLDP